MTVVIFYNCTIGGLIPLHNACSFGHVEVTLLLLRHGADVNSRDNWNYTPLHEAAIKGKVEVCLGKQLIHFIVIYKFYEFVWSIEKKMVSIFFFVVLLQHGADPSIQNTDGRTACDLADPTAKDVLTGMLITRNCFQCPFFLMY